MENFKIIKNKISQFKKTLLLNLFLKSGSFFLILFICSFLFVNYLEYFLYLPTVTKTVIFFSFLTIFLFLLIKQVIFPIKNIIFYDSILSNEKAALEIGKHFPDIKDKLLNTIQLENIGNQSLVINSIEQRALTLKKYDFNFAVKKEDNKKVYFLLIIPFILLIFTYLYNYKIISEGSQRLLHFNTAYQAPIPFDIKLSNEPLLAYKNESYTINFDVTGDYTTDDVYIILDEIKRKPSKKKEGSYSYTINKVSKNTNFNVLLSGYETKDYEIKLIERPTLINGSISIKYPEYVKLNNETTNNLTNLTVPEGSQIKWLIKNCQY